ncbi:hypothetical protein BCR44DRAFT_1443934 [Catenaria anguillulae PL171]|uniref:Uncharacterized protein n=1 Tax=Catenaria anguillulae PL171 TaxID=765915 RepID=A0A1Y2HAM1_9FUNG|nr:hypothetical protein BCR44DRAFT_1443934 [Catenaria anguillulae PL171]
MPPKLPCTLRYFETASKFESGFFSKKDLDMDYDAAAVELTRLNQPLTQFTVIAHGETCPSVSFSAVQQALGEAARTGDKFTVHILSTDAASHSAESSSPDALASVGSLLGGASQSSLSASSASLSGSLSTTFRVPPINTKPIALGTSAQDHVRAATPSLHDARLAKAQDDKANPPSHIAKADPKKKNKPSAKLNVQEKASDFICTLKLAIPPATAASSTSTSSSSSHLWTLDTVAIALKIRSGHASLNAVLNDPSNWPLIRTQVERLQDKHMAFKTVKSSADLTLIERMNNGTCAHVKPMTIIQYGRPQDKGFIPLDQLQAGLAPLRQLQKRPSKSAFTITAAPSSALTSAIPNQSQARAVITLTDGSMDSDDSSDILMLSPKSSNRRLSSSPSVSSMDIDSDHHVLPQLSLARKRRHDVEQTHMDPAISRNLSRTMSALKVVDMISYMYSIVCDVVRCSKCRSSMTILLCHDSTYCVRLTCVTCLRELMQAPVNESEAPAQRCGTGCGHKHASPYAFSSSTNAVLAFVEFLCAAAAASKAHWDEVLLLFPLLANPQSIRDRLAQERVDAVTLLEQVNVWNR